MQERLSRIKAWSRRTCPDILVFTDRKARILRYAAPVGILIAMVNTYFSPRSSRDAEHAFAEYVGDRSVRPNDTP